MGYAGSYEGEAIRACTHPCSRTDPPAPTSRQALCLWRAKLRGLLHVRAHGDTDHVCMGRAVLSPALMPAKMKERQQRFDAKPAAANASVTAMCEVVWVRCREPPPAWLPWHATIVEKCGLLSNRSVLSVDNKGDEGYGYLEWIMWRWSTLPPCVYLLHGSNSHLRLGLDLLLRSQRSVSSVSHLRCRSETHSSTDGSLAVGTGRTTSGGVWTFFIAT